MRRGEVTQSPDPPLCYLDHDAAGNASVATCKLGELTYSSIPCVYSVFQTGLSIFQT